MESLIKNNEKLIWILEINSNRSNINDFIIKRNYSNNQSKYYLTFNYQINYDLELYNYNISEVYFVLIN